MTNLILNIPVEQQTTSLAKKYYRFQLEHDGYPSSYTVIEHLHDYQRFKKRLEERDWFKLYTELTTIVTDVVGPRLESISREYRDEDWIIYDSEGLAELINVLEEGRQTFYVDGSPYTSSIEAEIDEGVDREIQRGINILKFAQKYNYGVTCSS